MKIRGLLLVGTGLTAGLAFGYLAAPRPTPAPSVPPAASTPTRSSRDVVVPGATKVQTQIVTNETVKLIDWRQVESADYKKYIANLRAIGCPEETKETLGDRYADYERAQDYSYQGLYTIAQRNGVSKEATVQVHDMKKPAEAEAKRVRTDKSLSPEQRDAALQAIQAETERSARAALGDKAFEAYKKSPAGTWLRSLNPAKK